MRRSSVIGWAWTITLFTAVGGGVVSACGSNSENNTFPGTNEENVDGGDPPPSFPPGDRDAQPGEATNLDVQPGDQTITVAPGANTPTVAFKATTSNGPVSVGWEIDRGEIGGVAAGPATSTVFTPSGRVGGVVTVTARLGARAVSRKVFVKIAGQQNGPTAGQSGQIATTVPSLTEGGGIGGVGGEGLGGAAADPSKSALATPAGNGVAEGLKLLYPYDQTVFPRGMLAPLLMWEWSTGDADAIQIELATTSGSFSWKGTFGRPAILATTGGKFIRHPIPQDVWKAATDSAGAAGPNGAIDRLTVKLTIAKGATAYGPITQTYSIAPGRLSGVVYYNSYGTRFAKNSKDTAVGGDGRFGGATLSIKVGETSPKLVAGSNATGADQENYCRVCHSVASGGSRLVTNRGGTGGSSIYDLSPDGGVEIPMAIGTEFPGLSPDGTIALSPNGKVLTLPDAGTEIATTGLTVTNVGTPAFAPTGPLVAFNSTGEPLKLFVAPFDKMTRVFGTAVTVTDNTALDAQRRPGWPAFLPDAKSIVFHQQVASGDDGNTSGALWTRKGARAYLAWTNTTDATKVTPLDKMNGKGYLPTIPGAANMNCTADGNQVGDRYPDHSEDANMNYEPTVNPAPSGGYAWVVFTSRRMYGNEATIPPFCSDPRGVDLVTNITPKKLWVAAIDLSAAPGTDASHPAFYLPAQELLAGNSRGFWVLDPCKAEGSGCESGDECCGGFCKPNSSGALTCSNTAPKCSGTGDKCNVSADCCDPKQSCIGGFCRQNGPR